MSSGSNNSATSPQMSTKGDVPLQPKALSKKDERMLTLRRMAIALALANLCFLRAWTELLTYTRANSFFMQLAPSPVHYAGLMTAVVVLALFLFAMTTIMHYKRGRFAAVGRWVFVLALLLPATAV